MPYRLWQTLLNAKQYAPSSQLIRDYLRLTDGLESPTPYHIWSFISMFAALVGGRVYIDQGAIGKKKLNLGVILTGFPAIKKSTAITVMQNFSEGLPLQYGPSDTAGQRQGIMSAMLPRWQSDAQAEKDEFDLSPMTLELLAQLDTSQIQAALQNPRIPPASELYFASKELGRLMAAPSRELIDFFTDAIDGESVHYQLKSQSVKIKHPLLNLLGATTPGSLSEILPRGATEHGFLSRLIFVYAAKPAARNPTPAKWNETQLKLRESMLNRIEYVLDRVDGGLELSEAALKTYQDVYDYIPVLKDVRLRAYISRRTDHLLKVAALLSLMRDDITGIVCASDVRLAHALLQLNEGHLPRAFYGLDNRPIGRVLLAATEFIESSTNTSARLTDIQSVKQDSLLAHLSHLGSTNELTDMIASLCAQEKLVSKNGIVTLEEAKTVEANHSRAMLQYVRGGNGLDEYIAINK